MLPTGPALAGPRTGSDRMVGVGVVDHMNLGAADCGGIPRPAGAVLVQPQAGGINQIRRAIELAAQTATGLCHQCSKQCLEHHARALGVGVSERRAGNLAGTQVVQSRRLAVHATHRLSQTAETRQLTDQQRHELTLRAQRSHPFVRAMCGDQVVEFPPRKVRQHPVQDRIPMLHRATLLVSVAAKQCHHRVQIGASRKIGKFPPDSRGTCPAIDYPQQFANDAIPVSKNSMGQRMSNCSTLYGTGLLMAAKQDRRIHHRVSQRQWPHRDG